MDGPCQSCSYRRDPDFGTCLGRGPGFNMATEGIGVGKEEGAFVAIFRFKIIMIKLVRY